MLSGYASGHQLSKSTQNPPILDVRIPYKRSDDIDHSSAACLSSITTCFLKNEEMKKHNTG